MGYDESWFQSQPVNDEFKCPICKEVFHNPQTADRCEHVFCAVCIRQCFKNSKNSHLTNWLINCPVCREQIHSSDLKPTIRAFRNLLDKLFIRCPFESCTWVVELQHFEQHRLDCDKNPTNQHKPCPKQCGAIVCHLNKNHNCINFLKDKVNQLEIENEKLRAKHFRIKSIGENWRQPIMTLFETDSEGDSE